MSFEEYWNKVHNQYSLGMPVYDNWLDKYSDIIRTTKTKILDLGSGTGNDTLYLINKGYDVIACDYSIVALDNIKKYIPKAEILLTDISKPLPFNDNTFDLIIADLSLHYFTEKDTIKILKEIKRVLTCHGTLITRLNSIYDVNYGAGLGKKIEENYYFVDGYNKRFFSIEDAKKYFSVIGEPKIIETEMNRYTKPKKVIEVFVTK
ncbi:MAG: class I SAM-dependent methyltransferase [Bacilli bacterium]|nr:class I SAM-dependent methyltransferase [Bacilli bacterium]